jgi:GrpB-like predicted nucleotidyltransferase (UPF0157 family)
VDHDRSVERRKVELAPHDPAWAAQAAAETARLTPAIGATLIRIDHVGSTSIPDIAAKPTIDLMPVVRSHAELEVRRPEIEALGYAWRGEFGIPGRRYCVREGNGYRLFNVHCFASGAPDIVRNLAFRDYLRGHRDEAVAYEVVKRGAAAAYPDDTLAYSDAKSDWIRACIDRAMAWKGRT